MFARRIPRLQEEIIDAGLVDGADGRVGVGIRGQQRTFSFREDVHCLLQKNYAVHVRHALIGEEQRHTVVAQFQLLEQRERRFGGIAPDYTEFSTVFRAQIALDGAQDIGVVVNT